ncbi:Ig-like domain-containing protein [Parabacteroides pacaensis]|uniref:Ig-like domain-containing protein n=1 Tax=Parabacteroides pacaensis TaxID=2086575 RepID=UPI000D0FAB6A|nr:Ig-like domain-containing protein [Parabacteroides pacaensis]
MKQTLFLLALILALFSCGKDELQPAPIDTGIKEEIYKGTGCYPNDPETLVRYSLFVDEENNVRYLYGSRNTPESRKNFWIAKFTSTGECIWETLHKNNQYSSRAHNFRLLKNGNILVANVLEGDEAYKFYECSPVIVSPKDGKTKFAKVFDGYFYSDVTMFDDFFFCTINENELKRNPKARDWCAQIDNEGNVIRHAARLMIPTEKVLFTNDSTFIEITPLHISKENIFGNYNENEWSYLVKLPSYDTCEMSLSFENNEVIGTYHLTINGKDSTEIYKLSYSTGKPIIKITDLAIVPPNKKIGIGKEYSLQLIVTPVEATEVDLIWKSSNPNIATVNEHGVIKGISEGDCIISASTPDGEHTASCEIHIVKENIEVTQEVSIINMNGYVTGSISTHILNVTESEITLTNIYVIDTSTNTTIAMADSTLLGILEPNTIRTFNMSLYQTYLPALIIEYKYKNKEYKETILWDVK